MLRDRYGLTLSTPSAAARDDYVEAVDRMLSASASAAEPLARALQADPGFALAHAAQARLHQLGGRVAEARESAARATDLARGTTPRERVHTEIMSRLVNGRGQEALALTREHMAGHPLDALALSPSCGVFGLIGFSGRRGREPEQLQLLEPLAAAYGDDWWYLSVLAFALVEVGQWQRGRELVERALEQFPRNAHGAHVLAHALYEAGEDRAAADFLQDWLPGYEADGQLHCHIWWHLCMARLMLGEHDSVWPLYDAHCAPQVSQSPPINVVTDGAALLWRGALAGLHTSEDRWQALRTYHAERFASPMVFVDAHGVLPMLGCGAADAAAAYAEQLQQLGAAGKLPAGEVPAALARGFMAHARGDWASAISAFEPVMDEVIRIGGSRAQRDLVNNTLADAYVRDGRPEDARSMLARRNHDRRPSLPVASLAAVH